MHHTLIWNVPIHPLVDTTHYIAAIHMQQTSLYNSVSGDPYKMQSSVNNKLQGGPKM